MRLLVGRGNVTFGKSYESAIAEWGCLSLDEVVVMRKQLKCWDSEIREWIHVDSGHPNPKRACAMLDAALAHIDRYIVAMTHAELEGNLWRF